jgi:uncharacterized protein YjgD (DUF1641 family)
MSDKGYTLIRVDSKTLFELNRCKKEFRNKNKEAKHRRVSYNEIIKHLIDESGYLEVDWGI